MLRLLKMNICMLLAVFRSRVTVTETFTANATWTAPITTSRIDRLVGQGAAGSPGYTEESSSFTVYRQTTQTGPSGNLVYQTEWELVGTYDGTAPSDYCDATIVNGTRTETCYRHEQSTNSTEIPPTTGASATGFSKTFVGGTGGAATPVTHNNVAVTPGATYSLAVPAGGSITITYTR